MLEALWSNTHEKTEDCHGFFLVPTHQAVPCHGQSNATLSVPSPIRLETFLAGLCMKKKKKKILEGQAVDFFFVMRKHMFINVD